MQVDYNNTQEYFSADSLFLSNAAPELERKKNSVTKIKQNKTAENANSAVNSFIACMSVVICIAVIFAMATTLIALSVSVESKKMKCDEIAVSINTVQSDNVRLKSEFNSALSCEKVEDYAVNILGMQKIERYQIHYFETRPGDMITFSGGKEVKTK